MKLIYNNISDCFSLTVMPLVGFFFKEEGSLATLLTWVPYLLKQIWHSTMDLIFRSVKFSCKTCYSQKQVYLYTLDVMLTVISFFSSIGLTYIPYTCKSLIAMLTITKWQPFFNFIRNKIETVDNALLFTVKGHCRMKSSFYQV